MPLSFFIVSPWSAFGMTVNVFTELLEASYNSCENFTGVVESFSPTRNNKGSL